MIEAVPESNLRSLCLEALYDAGFAGPNYNLDDVSAYVSVSQDGAHVSFWDMSCYVPSSDKLYKHIAQEAQEKGA